MRSPTALHRRNEQIEQILYPEGVPDRAPKYPGFEYKADLAILRACRKARLAVSKMSDAQRAKLGKGALKIIYAGKRKAARS